MTPPWRVEELRGPAASLLVAPPGDGRTVRFLTPVDRAVVLGSTQPASDIDAAAAAAAGVSILRRRSGGGAVLVGPGQVLWADVLVPVGDPLWHDDVGRAFWWLGEAWAAALATAGRTGAAVWRGPLVRTRWSGRVCFAGLGAGEVTVGGAKVLGVAQRRNREGAHFQCAVVVEWNPAGLLALLDLDDESRRCAERELGPVAAGIGRDVTGRLQEALVGHLP